MPVKKAEVFNLQNEKVGEIDLPEDVFGIKWNPVLVQQALRVQLANRRIPWAHTKGRAEVRGGGRKPWRQKGLGRARHGSIRSPIWVGGGVAHGPTKMRNYSLNINKKMKRLAIKSILSRKLEEGEIRFFESLNIDEPKTKKLAEILKKILSTLSSKNKKADILFIQPIIQENLKLASRNIAKTKVISAKSMNVYDLLNFRNIWIEKDAIEVISNHYIVNNKRN